MRTPILFAVLTIFSLLLAACAPQAAPASSSLSITLETNPAPAKAGDVELILTVKDAQGNPVTGALVSVLAHHPEMNDMNMKGQATDQGNGRYAIKANFNMSGDWKLTVEVKQGDKSVVQEIPLKVE